MKITDLFEKTNTRLMHPEQEVDLLDALYDNHIIKTNIESVPTGFILRSGKIVDTSDIDDHGEAILHAMDTAGIKRNPKVWDQRYVDYIVEECGLVRFRQDSMCFVDLPSEITKRQFLAIEQLVRNALDTNRDFTVAAALSDNLGKEFEAGTAKDSEILRAVRLLAKVV